MNTSRLAGTLAITGLAVFVVLAGPVMASTLTGTYYSPIGRPLANIASVTNQDGNQGGYQQSETTAYVGATQQGGIFTLALLTPSGNSANATYELYFNEYDIWYRQFEFGATVSSDSSGGAVTTTRNHQFIYPDYITGYIAELEVPTYYQTFKATGNWLSSIGYFQQKTNGPLTTFSILRGGPTGTQVGPSRTIPTMIVDPSTAYWNAGEVPLVPGQMYCVKITTPSVGSAGCRPMIPGAAILNGNALPDGRAFRTDSNGDGLRSVSGPVDIVINQDTDGVTTTVNTRKTKDVCVYALAVIAGQTFTAKGASLLSFSCLVGNAGSQTYSVSVFSGPGSKGQGTGTQIGPTKKMQPVNYNYRSAVVWKPGEVPLTPGQQYYVCIRGSANSTFLVYTDQVASEKYSGGSAYVYTDTNGTGGITNWDLSTTICEESYSGSTTTPNNAITYSTDAITRGSTSAVITWQTATANSSTYVEYGTGTPYAHTVSDSNPSSTSHSVTLTGLTPNTLYHARLTAVPTVLAPAANGYTTGITRDFVFVTRSANYPNDNLITNPSFEGATQTETVPQGTYQVPVGWTMGLEQGTDFGLKTLTAWPTGWFDSILPHDGSNFVGGAINGSSATKGYLYQTINTIAGRPICARAWLATYQEDQLGALQPNTCRGRIGIDPTGGTYVFASTVSWCQDTVAQSLFLPLSQWTDVAPQHQWTEVWDSANATGTRATIFLEAGADSNMAWTIWAWDDVYVTQGDIPPAFTSLGLAKQQPDGTLLTIGNSSNPLIVTATQAKTGDGSWYVEDSKRSGGLRVQYGGSPGMGDTVTLIGSMQTTPAGERYLLAGNALASDTAPPSSADPLYILQPFATKMSSLGKVGRPVDSPSVYAGADTTGMLVRVTGKIFNMNNANFIWAADGSLGSSSSSITKYPSVLKVVTSSQSLPIFDGDTYELTGIVLLSGMSPETAVPVLLLRDDEDAIDLGQP